VPAPHKPRRAEGTIRSLPIDLWPEADRTAWQSACRPAERLKRGGAAGHLKPVTRDDLARRYGYFLDFLGRRGLLPTDKPAAVHVTSDNVEAYITEIKQRVGSVTLYGSVYKLRRASQLIAPDRAFAWLTEIEKDLALAMRPRTKFDRLVLTEVLVEAGLSLIADAETTTSLTSLRRARQVRNGLMIALLALCPIRLKNFAALEIGRTFVEIKGKWWVVLAASETKENRADERPVDGMLNAAIKSYIATFRPVLQVRGSSSSALWLSSNDGMPMTYDGIELTIKTTTLSTIGVAVSPHLFRTSAASTAATRAGANPHLATALLHHTDPTVTNEHYNRASSVTAAGSLHDIVRKYAKTES
jgi:site-specific recombinase XerD